MASVASTYARAFADVIFGAHLDAARALGGLRQIAALLSQSAELRRVWENPAVPADQKRKLLDAIVQRNGIDRPVRNLIAVLIDQRRLPFLSRIVEQLEKELDARLGFTEAQISSARELGARSRTRLKKRPARRCAQGMVWIRRCWAAR
jgi:F-type H+-transporting ATPase subunit delta